LTTITGTTDEPALVQTKVLERVGDRSPDDQPDSTDTPEHLWVPELAIESCRRTRACELSVVSALLMVQLLWLSLLALGIVSLVH
jgi:hypothetical protein